MATHQLPQLGEAHQPALTVLGFLGLLAATTLAWNHRKKFNLPLKGGRTNCWSPAFFKCLLSLRGLLTDSLVRQAGKDHPPGIRLQG